MAASSELWKSSGSLDCLLRGSLSCPPARLLSFVLPLGTLLAKSFPSFQESLFPLCAYSQCLEHSWASAGSFSIWMSGLTSQVAHISLRALFACYLAMHGHTRSVSSLHSVWCVFSNTLRALEALIWSISVSCSHFCTQFSTRLSEAVWLAQARFLWEPWRLVKVKTRGGEARVLRTARCPPWGPPTDLHPQWMGKSAKYSTNYFCEVDGGWYQCISDTPDSRVVLASTEVTHLLKWNVEFSAHVGSIWSAQQPHGQQPPYWIPEIWDIDITVRGSAGHKYKHSRKEWCILLLWLKVDLWIHGSTGEGVYFDGTAKIAQLHVSVMILPSMDCFSVPKRYIWKAWEVNTGGWFSL